MQIEIFYQAYVAEQQLLFQDNLSEDLKNTLVSDYQENSQQTRERIDEAMQIIGKDSFFFLTFTSETGEKLNTNYNEFITNLSAWESSLNIKYFWWEL